MSTNTRLRFAYLQSDTHDTLAIVDGEKVVSQWELTPELAARFSASQPGEIKDWDLNYPDYQELSDYGRELTGNELYERVNGFLRG